MVYEYLVNTCISLYKNVRSVKENIRGVFVSTRVAAEECYSDEDSKDIPENNNLSLTLEEGFRSLSEPIFQEDTMNYASWGCHEPEGSPPIIVDSFWFRQFEEEGNDIAPTNMHFAPFSGFDKVGIEPLGSLYSIDEMSD